MENDTKKTILQKYSNICDNKYLKEILTLVQIFWQIIYL